MFYTGLQPSKTVLVIPLSHRKFRLDSLKGKMINNCVKCVNLVVIRIITHEGMKDENYCNTIFETK